MEKQDLSHSRNGRFRLRYRLCAVTRAASVTITETMAAELHAIALERLPPWGGELERLVCGHRHIDMVFSLGASASPAAAIQAFKIVTGRALGGGKGFWERSYLLLTLDAGGGDSPGTDEIVRQYVAGEIK